MLKETKIFLTSLLLVLVVQSVRSTSEPVPVQGLGTRCPDDFTSTCTLKCLNNEYLLDDNGCRKCACAKSDQGTKSIECPMRKCRVDCGDGNYQFDESGCRTCTCLSKENIQCPRAMCRMFCQYGFQRDENGCEYCSCNESPQPCPQLNCQKSCPNGYRKDYSGCNTCECECPQIDCPISLGKCEKGYKVDSNGCPTCTCNDDIDKKCTPLECNLNCENGFEKDESGCEKCACKRCPLQMCRMFCNYGFRRNNDGCKICECDLTPIEEKISCSERIPCEGTRVCNLRLGLCEKVDPDKVNWFVYDFQVRTDLVNDKNFVQIFKSDLINNIAEKYGLKKTQITVSSVGQNCMTSFQIMPFYDEIMDEFQEKIDQIDADLNSHEFRTVLPAVARAVDVPANVRITTCQKIKNFIRGSLKMIILMSICLIALLGFGLIFLRLRAYRQHTQRSESKSPIYDPQYNPIPTGDGHYAYPVGHPYVRVESEDLDASKGKGPHV